MYHRNGFQEIKIGKKVKPTGSKISLDLSEEKNKDHGTNFLI